MREKGKKRRNIPIERENGKEEEYTNRGMDEESWWREVAWRSRKESEREREKEEEYTNRGMDEERGWREVTWRRERE